MVVKAVVQLRAVSSVAPVRRRATTHAIVRLGDAAPPALIDDPLIGQAAVEPLRSSCRSHRRLSMTDALEHTARFYRRSTRTAGSFAVGRGYGCGRWAVGPDCANS